MGELRYLLRCEAEGRMGCGFSSGRRGRSLLAVAINLLYYSKEREVMTIIK